MLIWKVGSKGSYIKKSLINLRVVSSRCRLCIEGNWHSDLGAI